MVAERVTIDAGETCAGSSTTRSSATTSTRQRELVARRRLVAPDDPPIEHTFANPGTYTFLCTLSGHDRHGHGRGANPLENVLVFSKTGGFRHDSIPQGIRRSSSSAPPTASPSPRPRTPRRSPTRTSRSTTSSPSSRRPARCSTTRSRRAFERYIQSGGGFAGIHAASDTEYTWPWYGELVGGYFRSHPAGTPTATVDIEDGDEPSTTGLPASWTRVDEWYNFQDTTTPVVNGSATVADYSPRARHVHVLATVDESTYGEEDGNTVDDDHPVAWCSDFDGGRSWYTAMGHTQASFADANFRNHLLGGLRTAAGAEADCGEPRSMPPTARRLREGHARRRHQGADGDRHRRRTAACSTSSSASRSAAASRTRPRRADGSRTPTRSSPRSRAR